MKLVVIFGPPAVGKMTVAYALSQRIGLPVLHNHMTIELVLPFFPFGSPPFYRLVDGFRRRILEEIAAGDGGGVIFTYAWSLENAAEKQYVDALCDIFHSRQAQVIFVELQADLDERLRRNRTPFRLQQKPSKRDVDASERRLRANEQKYRFNSAGDFYYPDAHIKIDNTHLTPQQVAQQIVARFGWE